VRKARNASTLHAVSAKSGEASIAEDYRNVDAENDEKNHPHASAKDAVLPASCEIVVSVLFSPLEPAFNLNALVHPSHLLKLVDRLTAHSELL
jgi:hypothetical protein